MQAIQYFLTYLNTLLHLLMRLVQGVVLLHKLLDLLIIGTALRSPREEVKLLLLLSQFFCFDLGNPYDKSLNILVALN